MSNFRSNRAYMAIVRTVPHPRASQPNLNVTTPSVFFFFFQAEDGIRDYKVTGVQTCALPIYYPRQRAMFGIAQRAGFDPVGFLIDCPPASAADDSAYVRAIEEFAAALPRSEEHTSELQSPCNLVCRLLLENKNLACARLFALD